MFTTTMPFAAFIAFAALGANLLGAGLLLMINPRSRAVRWHVAFTLWLIAWLALQGWLALEPATPRVLVTYGWVVHVLPAVFLAEAIVETHDNRTTTALAVLLLGVVTAPVLNPISTDAPGMLWQAGMWGTGAVLHFRNRRRLAAALPPTPGAAGLRFALLVVVPVGVVGIILLSGSFLLYLMPLLTIVIQFMIFAGVVHHRFYDIEVRAARSSDIAAAGAEQDRLALLGELSATLAHEIRNPLTGMRSLAQRLTNDAVDDARRVRYAGVILGEVERLERIVTNLLDVAKRSVVRSGPPAATPLHPLFEDLMLLMEGRARRAGVTIHHDADGRIAAAPRDALAQALLNLLINAVAHSPAGGRIRLDAVAAAGDRVELRVTDSGPGVPPEQRARIFEPFRTGGAGAGLGLTVVRRLARELDWDVGITDASADDAASGACFYLRIPAVATTS